MAPDSTTNGAIPADARTSAVVRFAGDSGDGMQLAGTQLTDTSAILGNDVATLPDYPAEIRAPAGTVAGVSGFQVNFAADQIFTPGDQVNALIAMNPAAFKAHHPRRRARRHRHRQRDRVLQDQPQEGRLRARLQPD